MQKCVVLIYKWGKFHQLFTRFMHKAENCVDHLKNLPIINSVTTLGNDTKEEMFTSFYSPWKINRIEDKGSIPCGIIEKWGCKMGTKEQPKGDKTIRARRRWSGGEWWWWWWWWWVVVGTSHLPFYSQKVICIFLPWWGDGNVGAAGKERGERCEEKGDKNGHTKSWNLSQNETMETSPPPPAPFLAHDMWNPRV